MDLRRIASMIRLWLPVLVGGVVLGGAGGYIAAGFQTRTYEAAATLAVGQALSGVNPDYNQLLVSQRLTSTYATIATTDPVLDRVVRRLGLSESTTQLARRISTTAGGDSALLTVTAQDRTPEGAAALANAVAAELIAGSPAVQGQQTEILKSIDEDVAAIRSEIRTTVGQIEALTTIRNPTVQQTADIQRLQDRVATLRSAYATLLTFSTTNASNLLTVIEPAKAPESPVAPRPLLNAVLAAFAALALVAAIALTVEYLDDTIRGSDDAEDVAGLPTLATVMRMSPRLMRHATDALATLVHPRSPAAEAYRTLRTNVEFASIDRTVKTLVVTSAVPGEGKTVTAANLAVAFAQAGRRVLLIDADLRRPGVHELFALPSDPGLTSMIRSDDPLAAGVIHGGDPPGLDVLTAGPVPPNPAELLGTQRLKTLIAALGERYDMLIFDSAPVDLYTDSAVLASFLDAAILVVAAGRSRRAPVRRAREALARVDSNVLGIVLNGVRTKPYPDYATPYALPPEAAEGANPSGAA